MFIKPIPKNLTEQLNNLKKELSGDLHYSNIYRLMYATDASVYREIPLCVIYPRNKEDIKKIIFLAKKEGLTIIPRTAGTSLAGQVVGNGIVVDVSKYLTGIIELNVEEKWVKVQPGVILDELNKYLEPHGLFFGPETSTSNRCMIGGMVGNNACGAHSLIYGSTRDHVISLNVILSDGSEAVFGPINNEEIEKKITQENLESSIYKFFTQTLSQKHIQENIHKEYPLPTLKRRNTGYALDIISMQQPFNVKGNVFNLAKLLTGSEGTLAFTTEITLNLVELPPKTKGLLCAHFRSINESLKANLVALKHAPVSIELIDNVIINCTKQNIEQRKNRFFIEGEPGAILMIEFFGPDENDIRNRVEALINEFKELGYGYHFPLLTGTDISKAWALRKAGLGLLSNVEGDAKPVAVIEDTAVDVTVLPDYIEEFQQLLKKHHLECVYYAHAATGELHLRPVLNLKKEEDVKLFRTILHDIALLVKKYRGSLSGEHGDGRLRGEFIPLMLGEDNYKLIKAVKKTFDPDNIFNASKIVDTPPMNTSLRYSINQKAKAINTTYDFSKYKGILGAVELCNGSADCRKPAGSGALMCPSYMATLNETDCTRARANILREFLTHSHKTNPFDHQEIYEVMDLCLSCKACKSECPSNVDMAKLKGEFLHHYYKAHTPGLRTILIAHITSVNKAGSIVPWLFNYFVRNRIFSGMLKKILGFAPKRAIPMLHNYTLNYWAVKHLKNLNKTAYQKTEVVLFNDEFTNFNDTETGIKAVKLLSFLGYKVTIPRAAVSGRTFISKGLLGNAQKAANKNIRLMKKVVGENSVLIGIEPSAILSFRDEYIEFATPENKENAQYLSGKAFMLDEFLWDEVEKGHIDKKSFTKESRKIYLHGHCHQKALASIVPTKKILEFPENYTVVEIKSSCCGMAGSFGYEKEHFETSMKVGELVLLPAVRKAEAEAIICAPGTSCRQQIKDGTGRTALHPAVILYDALVKH